MGHAAGGLIYVTWFCVLGQARQDVMVGGESCSPHGSCGRQMTGLASQTDPISQCLQHSDHAIEV